MEPQAAEAWFSALCDYSVFVQPLEEHCAVSEHVRQGGGSVANEPDPAARRQHSCSLHHYSEKAQTPFISHGRNTAWCAAFDLNKLRLGCHNCDLRSEKLHHTATERAGSLNRNGGQM